MEFKINTKEEKDLVNKRAKILLFLAYYEGLEDIRKKLGRTLKSCKNFDEWSEKLSVLEDAAIEILSKTPKIRRQKVNI